MTNPGVEHGTGVIRAPIFRTRLVALRRTQGHSGQRRGGSAEEEIPKVLSERLGSWVSKAKEYVFMYCQPDYVFTIFFSILFLGGPPK